jgi:hypothetical protein
VIGVVCSGLLVAGRLRAEVEEGEADCVAAVAAGETESSKSVMNTGTDCGVGSRAGAVMLGVDSGGVDC